MAFLHWNISIVLSFCCVFMTAGEEPGQLPAPVDPKIEWESEFCPKISWTKPSIPDGCEVKFTIEERKESDTQMNKTSQYQTKYTHLQLNCMSREEGLIITITTTPITCLNHSKSKSVALQIPRNTPEVVKNFRCVYYTHRTVNCTWQPSPGITHLQSWFIHGQNSPLHPCPLSMLSGSQLIGCHWNMSDDDEKLVIMTPVLFLINGTQGSDTVHNTFKAELRNIYKPAPPEVSIELAESKKELLFSWNSPDFPQLQCFMYQLNYTECDKPETVQVLWIPAHANSYSVSYNSRCKYSVTVRSQVADTCGQGGSEPSLVQVYGSNSSDLQMIVIVICLGVFMCVGVLLFFFVNKYRGKLPKIPESHLGGAKGLMQERVYVPAV